MIATFTVIYALIEWWRWYREVPPNPILHSGIAVLACALAAWRVRKAFKKVKSLKLGRDGEKAVGQFLEALRVSGAQVFHDIPGKGFNLDHVVIHTSGIYVVETKTWSKPDKGEAKLLYDGESVSKAGFKPDRNPVTQVRAARDWLGQLIEESTGRKFPARAVVAFPGWYIKRNAEAKRSDVWVLNLRALSAFIEHSDASLAPEDVRLCAFHLSRYIRTEK